MSVPEGWEWLNDLPQEWETPTELQGPTESPEANLVIRILSNEVFGHEVRAAVGRFVTEHALFTIWFADDVKRSDRSMQEAALLSQIPAEETRKIYEAWKRFRNVDELDAPREELRDRRMTTAAGLTTALEGAAEKLARVRGRNVG